MAKQQKIESCEKCGRNHPTSKCYAKTTIDCNLIKPPIVTVIVCEFCGEVGHEMLAYPLYSQIMQEDMEEARKNNACSRCNKKGHYRIACYETQDSENKDIDSCVIS